MSVDFDRYLFEVHATHEDLAGQYKAYSRPSAEPVYSLLGFAIQLDGPSGSRCISASGYTGQGCSGHMQNPEPQGAADPEGKWTANRREGRTGAGGGGGGRGGPPHGESTSGQKTHPPPSPQTSKEQQILDLFSCQSACSRSAVNQPLSDTYMGSGSTIRKRCGGGGGGGGGGSGGGSGGSSSKNSSCSKSNGTHYGGSYHESAGVKYESLNGSGQSVFVSSCKKGLTRSNKCYKALSERDMNKENIAATLRSNHHGWGLENCSSTIAWKKDITMKSESLVCNGSRDRLATDVKQPLLRTGNHTLQMHGNPNNTTAGRFESSIQGACKMRPNSSFENLRRMTSLNGATSPKGGREVLPSILHPRPPSPPLESRNLRNVSSKGSLRDLKRKVTFADEKGLTLETFFVLATEEEEDPLCSIAEEEEEYVESDESDCVKKTSVVLEKREMGVKLCNSLMSEIEWCNTEIMVFENTVRHLPTISYINRHSSDVPSEDRSSCEKEFDRDMKSLKNVKDVTHGQSRLNGKNESAMSRVTCQLLLDLPDVPPTVIDQRINTDMICLESVKTMDRKHSLLCTIRVKNICFAKKVFLRCTQDSWATNVDLPASYMYSDKTKATDVFTVAVGIPSPAILAHVASSRGLVCHANNDSSRNGRLVPVHVMEMAVCFVPSNCPCEYWDNNSGHNYRIVWEIK